MSDDAEKSGGGSRKADQKAAREARLAKALRDNLRRRSQQRRDRGPETGESGKDSG